MTTLSPAIRQYALITANYWAFTLTDGALRMLVVLHFHQLGYSPLSIAALFLFYEIFGVITNLAGGYLGARIGLNRTMNIGLGLQVIALLMLAVPAALLTLPWVMAAQAFSGIAKDLNKMSAKSAIKIILPPGQQGRLFKWVALLTGSKNALKGVGFFVGGTLLSFYGFKNAVMIMAIALGLIGLSSMLLLTGSLGKAKNKPKFSQLLSKSRAINLLSAARLFLFGSRDVWFVVALPVYLSSQLGWSFANVGGFLASWVIGYGLVQSMAPAIVKNSPQTGIERPGILLFSWAVALALITALMAITLPSSLSATLVISLGLLVFGFIFAVNSSLHSFLIVAYANRENASLDVGFYYMANAMGRLIGTLLSGWAYQSVGLIGCLWVSVAFIVAAAVISLFLPRGQNQSA